MNKLLKDAIADAKAVRETALAQAKLALEEAFAPKLQSMLSNKIMQEMDTEDEGLNRNPATPEVTDETSLRMRELAGLYEADPEEGGDEMGGEDDLDMGDDEMGDMEGEEDTEFTINGQTYNIVPAEDEEGLEGEEGMEDEDGMEGEDEELAELLRQLEEDEIGEGRGAAQDPDASDEENDYWRQMNSLEGRDPHAGGEFEGDDEEYGKYLNSLEEMNDEKKKESSKFKDMQTEVTPKSKGDYDPQENDDEIDLHELIQALKEEDDEEYKKAPDQAMDTAKGSHGNVLDERKKMKKMKEDLNEAYTAVKYLREKLSEVNLLNAKLLYVNKLFRKTGLTESQKIKIIETFDRAKNVRETKLIYATLSESMNTTVVKTKKPVVENFASAPVKKTQVINEGTEQMKRFKQLAGIIKS